MVFNDKGSDKPSKPDGTKRPILVPKNGKRPKKKDRYIPIPFTDERSDFDFIFEKSLGKFIKKYSSEKSELLPPLSEEFNVPFNPIADNIELSRCLTFDSAVPKPIQERVIQLVKNFWCCFREDGLIIPIKGYEMVIDTGASPPVNAKKIHYGIHESPIMQKTIDVLLKSRLIIEDSESSWNSNIVLAPKPHQEHITEIDDYIWRFCISYVALNLVTRVINYPIPRCDDAVMNEFGRARFFILLDAYSGYHQIKMASCSVDKTAFSGPHGRKYKWLVMPFGLRNSPAVFICMMHDLKQIWDKILSEKMDIGENNGSRIIMDDVFIFAETIENAFIILETICEVAKHYCLTWKLKKTQFFHSTIEFVGVDVSAAGNQPADAKATTLKTWKYPIIVRDIASFLGFIGFYARWIPNYELKSLPLRKIIREYNYPDKVTSDMFGKVEKDTFDYLRDCILSQPILIRADVNKRFYLKTDFSALGMGFALCQPDNSPEALQAMREEDAGAKCQFDLCFSKLRLHPICFGSRKCLNNERYFHSFVGEATAAAWAITKNRHFLWGRPFTLLTDCNALVWLMTYRGTNAAIRRLMLEMTGYWFTIEHRPNKMMADPDYWSRLNSDHDVNPLLKDYILHFKYLWKDFPPASGAIDKTNTPGRKRSQTIEDDTFQGLFAMPESQAINIKDIFDTYYNVPVKYSDTSESQSYVFSNDHMLQNRYHATKYNWACYGFSSGHMQNSILQKHLPFDISYSADPNPAGRDLFAFFGAKKIFKYMNNLLQALTNCDDTIDAIYITCPDLSDTKHQDRFITECSHLMEIGLARNVKLVIIESNIHFKMTAIENLASTYTSRFYWTTGTTFLQFTDFNDKIDDGCNVTIFFNSNEISPARKVDLAIPRPPMTNLGFYECIHKDFNKREFHISSFPSNFNKEYDFLKGVPLEKPHLVKEKARPIARIHRLADDENMPTLQGTFVYDSFFPAPPLGQVNDNVFGKLFGLIYKDENDMLVTRKISYFEYCRCFGLENEVLSKMSENARNLDLFRNAMPANTSASLFEKAADLLHLITIDHEEFAHRSNPDIAPAAVCDIFNNGIIHHKLPTDETWRQALLADEECRLILQMLKNPALITPGKIDKLHYALRHPMRQSMIYEEDGIIFIRERVPNKNISFSLRLVPKILRNIIFIAFHANPMGGHFALYQTLHRIRLRFYWPRMVKYIENMISKCTGCKMANATLNRKQNYLYSFPIDAPFRTIHIDIYSLGKTESFDGDVALFIVLDHMTSFAVIEPVKETNSKTFAKALMKILLTHGLCHTVIVDADSKFKATFAEVISLLNLNKHDLSKGNHQAMLVERFNRYLNKVMKIFTNERNSTRTYVEGALLAAYAWNSSPISGTDISKSLLVMGREFNFPIDYATDRTFSTNNDPAVIFEYTKDLVDTLQQSREIYRILIDEHRAMHREIKNSQVSNEIKFRIGDIVFARRQVKSNKQKGIVDKAQFQSTGPWIVVTDLKNGSYELQSIKNKNKIEKQHASNLDLCPSYFLPQQPLIGTDNSYSQINKDIQHNRFKHAGINEKPANDKDNLRATFQPDFQALASEIATTLPTIPSSEQLNDSSQASNSANDVISNNDDVEEGNIQNSSQLQPRKFEKTTLESQQPQHILSILIPKLISSQDKLFFISHAYKHHRRREWKLVQLDLKATMEFNPTALTDGKFLVKYLIAHPHDSEYKVSQQRFWPHYHKKGLAMDDFTTSVKFIRPAPESDVVATKHNLTQVRFWVKLDDPSVYIHGPFEFAIVNGRKTVDKIDEKDWKILKANSDKYHDDGPSLSSKPLLFYNLYSPFVENIKRV